MISWDVKGSSYLVTCELHKLSVLHSELLVWITIEHLCQTSSEGVCVCVCVCVRAVFAVRGHIEKTKHH